MTKRRSTQSKQWRLFEDARQYVRSLNIKNHLEWRKYCKSGKKPDDIPRSFDRVYKDKGFTSNADFFGYEKYHGRQIEPGSLLSFEEAKILVKSLGIKNLKEYDRLAKEGKLPKGLPKRPDSSYKDKGWKGYYHFLDYKSNKILSFKEARELARSLGCKRIEDYYQLLKQKKLREGLPSNPLQSYRDQGWNGWRDYLGYKSKEFLSYKQAKEIVRSLNIKSVLDYDKARRQKRLPKVMPARPDEAYRDQWIDYYEFFGLEKNVKPLLFREAVKLTRTLNIKTVAEYRRLSKEGKLPAGLPSDPATIYKDYWLDWFHYLGTEDPTLNVEKVKELLRALIESEEVKKWANDEAILYSILDMKEMFNLSDHNRHRDFFRNLPEAIHIKKAFDEIKKYANSGPEEDTPPDLSKYTGIHYREKGDQDEEIQQANAEELAKIVDDRDPLDYGEIATPKEVLDKIGRVESICSDGELMELLVNHSIGKLLRSMLRTVESSNIKSNEAKEFIATLKKNGNKYHDEVIDRFLEDYKGAMHLLDKLPRGYKYEYEPKLMQAYVAYKILRKNFFLNLSGVGAGKTLSAILASRAIDSKMTIIVCPYDIVGQWSALIKKVFPDSIVYSSNDIHEGGIGKKAFYAKRRESKYQYVVLNYDKFSLPDTRQLILKLTNQTIDFVILDEIHFVKRSNDENRRDRHKISQRNTNAALLRSEIKRHNKNIRVLGMTATPVINDLAECRSLIELVTGQDYHDELSTKPTIRNAIAFYGKLQIMSVREMPDYHVQTDRQEVDVSAYTDRDVVQVVRNPLQLEQILTEARIPEIIKSISKDSKTIIYTEYVDRILQRLREEVKKAGFTFTEYTGIYKELDSFVKGRAQVLIASKPIAVGVEGLQEVCDNLIINTLPWTNAHYQQLVGRLVRRGQPKNSVKVHIIKASINDYPYDERLKWNRIRYKRSLGDCVTDGIMPLKNLVSVAEASRELKNWLERMNRNEITMIERKDINIELTPQEIKQRTRVFGDFSKMNKQYNQSRSEINHKRIQENPMYLVEYHRQMREAKKDWGGIIPVEIIADKIRNLRLPSRFIDKLVIGDFGCGEAQLSSLFSNNKVYSFDHHNILNEEKIMACDMKDTSHYLKENEIDVAIFSLSLMATNWSDYIKEARRVLIDRGYLFIAEVTRSLSAKGSLFNNEEGRLYKLREVLEREGFEITSDKEKGKFTFIDAQKR